MKKKNFCLMVLLALTTLTATAQDAKRPEVLMETSMGNLRIQLYNETPLHRDNFLRLVSEHFYDSLSFHRVIKDFMVQGGRASGAKTARVAEMSTVEPEFRLPQLFHKRGALAAAREGDDVNPEKRSSPTQFYFVWGRKYSERAMEFTENRLDLKLTPEMRQAYMTEGGTPHLDGSYTVFGQVVEGLDVLERMQAAATDQADCPLEPIVILRATVVE